MVNDDFESINERKEGPSDPSLMEQILSKDNLNPRYGAPAFFLHGRVEGIRG